MNADDERDFDRQLHVDKQCSCHGKSLGYCAYGASHTKEYHEELEHDLDETFGCDGW